MSRNRARPMAALAVALLLQACANGPGNPFASNYDDPADSCSYARQPLVESRQDFSKAIIIGASNAITALSGYFAATMQQYRTRPEMIAAIDRNAASDNRTLITARNSIGTLTRCRRKQVADIDRDYRAHRITASQARQQLEAVHGQMHTDDQLIGDVLGKAGDRSKTYVNAKTEAAGQPARGRTTTARASTGATGALQQTEHQAQQQQTEHRDVDTGLQKRINDLSASVG